MAPTQTAVSPRKRPREALHGNASMNSSPSTLASKTPSSEGDGVSPSKRARLNSSSSPSKQQSSPTRNRTQPSHPSNKMPEPMNCKCGNEAIMFQVRNGKPENRGRWFAKCDVCKFWEWASPALPEPASTAEESATSSESTSEPVNDSDRPPKTLTCDCSKPAYMWKARGGKPENIGKWFGKCATEECTFFSRADLPQPPVVLRCDCGQPARMLQAKHGMPHNYGMWFGVCAKRRCKYWRWEDGGEPFGDEAVDRFGHYFFQCCD